MNKNSVKSSTQDFSKTVHANIERSIFNRNSTLVTTFNAGDLVPIYIDEVLPGDTFKMSMDFVSRLITPIQPVMDNINLEFYAFYVPNRILWDGWEELNGENKSGAWTPSSPPASVPVYNGSGSQGEKTVGDYYGIPLNMAFATHPINVLPFRGYRKIYNDWFRNQNVQAPLIENKGDTAGSALETWNMPLLKVNKPFDYFTSCLPSPQKGESQLIPISLNELIPIISGDNTGKDSATGMKFYQGENSTTLLSGDRNLTFSGILNKGFAENRGAVGTGDIITPANLWADGRNIELNGSTISDLRTAFQIQRLYERDARGGTRYIEMLKAHFGVDAGDYRLQRAEYLGHINSMINIEQVAQTSETTVNSPQGNLSAYGHAQGSNNLFVKSFVEHGFVHIFAVARHKKTYQQGLDRFWSRRDRLDYFLPVLGHISEQPVFTKEIFALNDDPDEIFGYNEAWSDYRYKPSRITGQMRQAATDSFDIWHYADYYTLKPILSDEWMKDNSAVNLERTLAIQDTDQILLNVRFNQEATRPMPTNSIPGMIDHF